MTSGVVRSHDPIRVLHFVANSYPTEYFRLIARHTDRARFSISVGSLTGPGELHDGLQDLSVSSFALGAATRADYPIAALRLAARLRRGRIDVVHTHLFDAALVGLTAARLAGSGLAIFTGHHSHQIPLFRRRLLFELDRAAARRLADIVIAPSQEMKETFLRVYGCSPDTVHVIEHGVDTARFDPGAVDGHEVRRELGLEGKLVLGAVSKHFWVKNLDALVRAFAVLAKSNDDLHLVILGGGDRLPLARSIATLGLDRRVSLLPPRQDVPEVLASFDVFVHPALAESFGLAIVEAMAMQLPVVSTPTGIARDVIEDGVSGFCIRGTTVDPIVEALERALSHRGLWPDLGFEARRRAQAFSPKRWVAAHERLYERQLSRGKARRDNRKKRIQQSAVG